MKKYDITQKVEFRTGTYNLNQDANFNFQLNRVIMWDGGYYAGIRIIRKIIQA